MKLYAAYTIVDYEGGYMVGIFNTKEKAELAIKEAEWKMDGSVIYEVDLNERLDQYNHGI